jgi:hypothetical protein
MADEDDDDDDDMPSLDFNHLMRRAGATGGFAAHAMPPGSLFDFGMSQHRAAMLRMPHSPSRTYASNSLEQNAGTVANPLEIDLEDDDDEVEVILARANPSV